MPNPLTPTELIANPRRLIGLCATIATLLGCLYLLLAGAPIHYPLINGLALMIGLGWADLLTAPLNRASQRTWGLLLLAAALIILLTALLGVSVEGISRWIAAGPILLQPGLVLLPLMMMRYAQQPDRLSHIAILITAVGLALQPDRSLAAALALSTVLIAASIRSKGTVLSALAALLGGIASGLQDDPLPGVPYVEGVYQSAFRAGPAAIGLVLTGTLILLLPFRLARPQQPQDDLTIRIFGFVWLCLIGAAAFGQYPTPLVGYSSSAILAYTLCLLGLPAASSAGRTQASA